MHKGDLDAVLPPLAEEPTAILPTADYANGRKLLGELARLRTLLVARTRADRRTERAGLLWGAMSELPSYLDLASEVCGPFVIAYPEEAGGEEVAVGASFPASWRSPKERWLLEVLRTELARDRRVLVFLRHTGNRGFVGRLRRLIAEAVGEEPTFLDLRRCRPASASAGSTG